MTEATGLTSFGCEISNGGVWVDLNDGVNFRVSGEGTKTDSQTRWRKIVASSPVVEGSYMVHAVKDEVEESLTVYVRGTTQTEVSTKVRQLEDLFSQFSYQIRFTWNESVETWDCQTADYAINRSQIYAHSTMAIFSATVPRSPTVTYTGA